MLVEGNLTSYIWVNIVSIFAYCAHNQVPRTKGKHSLMSSQNLFSRSLTLRAREEYNTGDMKSMNLLCRYSVTLCGYWFTDLEHAVSGNIKKRKGIASTRNNSILKEASTSEEVENLRCSVLYSSQLFWISFGQWQSIRRESRMWSLQAVPSKAASEDYLAQNNVGKTAVFPYWWCTQDSTKTRF